MNRSGWALRRAGAAGTLVLLAALAGCRHKAAAPPPPPAPAPAAASAPAPITVITPLPSLPPEAKPTNVQPAQPETPAPAPVPVRQRLRRKIHRAKPSIAETGSAGAPVQAAPPAKETASLAAASAAQTAASPVSAGGVVPGPPGTPGPSYNESAAEEAAPQLGQLSTGTAISQPARLKMLEETESLEGRLLKLKQTASQEAASVRIQVQVFLKRAREAVEESDLDGAQTLNTKARVLLSELESQ